MKNKLLIVAFFLFFVCLNVRAATPFLTDLKVDGNTISGFKADKYEYTLEVDANKDKITLAFAFDNTTYSGSGAYGEQKLNPGKNTFVFTLKSIANPEDKKSYTIIVNRKDVRSSDNALASLTVGGKKITLDNNKNDYEITVQSDVKEVKIQATLSNAKASFVQGYGERTVTLIGERTTNEVRVQAENGNVRTYKITVIKSDYKSNDATLKSLKIKEINFNFNSNTTEYNLEVQNDITEVNLEAVANDTKATVTYNKKYTLKEGKNNITITVTAEDGSKKEYKLVITRKEEEPLVKNIEIKDIDFDFKNDVYDYEIETDLSTLEFNVTLNSKTAKSTILNNEDLSNGSIVKVEVVDGSKKVTYNFKIKNEKSDDDDSDEEIAPIIEDIDSNNNDNNITSDMSFLKKYEMYIGLGTFGLGLLSLLIAIITKPKGSQIM